MMIPNKRSCTNSMEDLPEALLGEIIKRLPTTSDLNSISLVSKQLYIIEAQLRDAIHIGCGVSFVTVALVSLCSRFQNLRKVEFNYSGWTPNGGMQLNNEGLCVVSSCCHSLADLTLSFCSYIDDSGLDFLACCKKLTSLYCPMLQSVELTFYGCEPDWPEIGFTQEGLVTLIQSCPIRELTLGGVNIFDDKGMRALSDAQFLESLRLFNCIAITDAGMRLLAFSRCLINLTLELCDGLTDDGLAEFVRARKLESLTIEKCSRISQKAVQGAAKTVHYTEDCPGIKNWMDCCVYGCIM